MCPLQGGTFLLQVGMCLLQGGTCLLQVGMSILQGGMCLLQGDMHILQGGTPILPHLFKGTYAVVFFKTTEFQRLFDYFKFIFVTSKLLM